MPSTDHESRTVPLAGDSRSTLTNRPTMNLSVALCTWNGARWIRPFLESLAAQQLLPDELVVQDDASDDDTAEVVRSMAPSLPFEVRLEVNPERVGSTANFALALERCRGRFVALADQDDIWYPEKLSRLVHEFDQDPILTLVFSDADLIGEDGRPLERTLWSTRMVHGTLRRRPIVPEEFAAREALTTGGTVMLRRRVIDAALPFPPELDHPVAPMRHDRWLTLIAAAVGTVEAVPERLVGFRVHDSQETGVLIGGALPRRAASGIGTHLLAPDGRRPDGLRARAAQLRVAAERADLLGDFDEARTLRRVADDHVRRARIDEPGSGRLALVAAGVRQRSYRADARGLGGVALDTLRALLPRRSTARSAPGPELARG
ncbi:MAG: glycosyltransferase [Microthrixaceae bacterium]